MNPTVLSAPGLVLSTPRPADIDAIAAACEDRIIQRWTAVPTPYTRDDAKVFCTTIVPGGWQTGTLLTWAVRERPAGEPIAMVSLRAQPGASWEIGFWTAAPVRGRGVMTHAARAVIDAAFDAKGPLRAGRLEWRCEIDEEVPNWASWRVAWSLGFHKQGRLRGVQVHAGRRRDIWVADLLPEDPRRPAEPWDGPATHLGRDDVEVALAPTDAAGCREGALPEGLVRRFHRVYGLPVAEDSPSLSRPHLDMRMSLIAEEFGELVGAVYGERARRSVDAAFGSARAEDDQNRDVIATADALADLVYVVYGMALETGIDLPAVLAEVQRSNMSKLGSDGKPLYRADGKVLKGPHYRAPDIASVLARRS